MKTTELYHYGVKGMKWGVRKDKIKKGINKAVGSFLGIENKHLNRALSSSGKLRKAYFEAQKLGVKTNKKGQYKYSHDDKELYKKQQAAARKAKRFADEFLQKYNKQPMSYLQSKNAQRGAAIGAAAGLAVPIIFPLWATISAGYYIGSKIGGSNVKHSDELMHYGVKGMKWHKHLKRREESTTEKHRREPQNNNPISTFMGNVQSASNDAERIQGAFVSALNSGDPEAIRQAYGQFYIAYQTNPHFRDLADSVINSYLEDLENRNGVTRTVYAVGRGVMKMEDKVNAFLSNFNTHNGAGTRG